MIERHPNILFVFNLKEPRWYAHKSSARDISNKQILEETLKQTNFLPKNDAQHLQQVYYQNMQKDGEFDTLQDDIKNYEIMRKQQYDVINEKLAQLQYGVFIYI